MNKVSFNLLFGLSYFYEYCSIFKRFDDVEYEISLAEQRVTCLRPIEYYYLMKRILLEHISEFKNVSFRDDVEFQDMYPYQVFRNSSHLSIRNQLTDIYYPSVKELNMDLGNYIVINTKAIPGDNIRFWADNKNYLRDRIKELPVVIVGERESMKCKEYDIHNVQSFYREIKTTFANIIDLTVDTTSDLYSDKIMTRNLNILKNSLFNIHFGTGGGRIIYAHLNHSILVTDEPIWEQNLFSSIYKNSTLCDREQFNKVLNEFLYESNIS